MAADLGDLSQFKNGRQFGAWLGLVPKQHSTGGKQRLGHMTKRGDSYLRHLIVMGARAALRAAPKRDDAVSRWACALQKRAGRKRMCVALANKNARHLWLLLARHVRVESGPTEAADPVGGRAATPRAERAQGQPKGLASPAAPGPAVPLSRGR